MTGEVAKPELVGESDDDDTEGHGIRAASWSDRSLKENVQPIEHDEQRTEDDTEDGATREATGR